MPMSEFERALIGELKHLSEAIDRNTDAIENMMFGNSENSDAVREDLRKVADELYRVASR